MRGKYYVIKDANEEVQGVYNSCDNGSKAVGLTLAKHGFNINEITKDEYDKLLLNDNKSCILMTESALNHCWTANFKLRSK